MRNRSFVAYDVMEPARLIRTYKKMLGYGDRVQYSVFICSLIAQELVMMRGDLEGILNLKEDRVIIINTGPANASHGKNIITLGTQISPRDEGAVVV